MISHIPPICTKQICTVDEKIYIHIFINNVISKSSTWLESLSYDEYYEYRNGAPITHLYRWVCCMVYEDYAIDSNDPKADLSIEDDTFHFIGHYNWPDPGPELYWRCPIQF